MAASSGVSLIHFLLISAPRLRSARTVARSPFSTALTSALSGIGSGWAGADETVNAQHSDRVNNSGCFTIKFLCCYRSRMLTLAVPDLFLRGFLSTFDVATTRKPFRIAGRCFLHIAAFVFGDLGERTFGQD